MANLHGALTKAVDVAKEYARGGGSNPSGIIETVYRKLVEIETEIENSGQ